MSAYRPFTAKSTPKITYGNYLNNENEEALNLAKKKKRSTQGLQEQSSVLENVNPNTELYKKHIPENKLYQNSEGEVENGSETSAHTQEPSVYSEYLKNAMQDAQNTKDQAHIDAENAYKKALSSYGSNAEALGRMGLTSSGFSDYLTAQAYAANNTSKAIADADYNKAVREAKYQDYVTHQQDYVTHQQDYRRILADVNTGAISSTDIDSLKSTYNLTEDEVASLQAAANSYTQKIQDENYLAIVQQTGTDLDQLEALYDLGKISYEVYKSEVDRIKKSNYEKYLEELKTDPLNFDLSTVASGALTDDDYKKLKEKYNSFSPKAVGDFEGKKTKMSWLDEDISVAQLRDVMNKSAGFGIDMGGKTNYRVSVDSEMNLNDYPLLKGRLDAAKVGTRELFTMNGGLYIRHGDLIFKLKAHEDRPQHWQEIRNYVGI